MGFPYHKIDFLYTQSLRAAAQDPRVTRAARLRRGLAAVRAGAGDEAFVLGCGCPLGPPSVSSTACASDPDTAPYWHLLGPRIAGLEATLPSGRNALRNTLARAFQHRRFWLNDPDCLMARSKQSSLTRDEVRALAASIAVTGGMAIFSDDVPALTADERAMVRDTIALAREVDEAAHAGTARAAGLLDAEIAPAVVSRAGADWLVALFNDTEESRRSVLELATHGVDVATPAAIPLLGSARADVEAGSLAVELPPHGAALYRVRGAPRLAVFCDFDGTFAVQDVGSTIARRYAAARRAELWPRLERGEFDAWAYNMELLDGLALPEAELEAFLRTVELDPGARDLVRWCERQRVPFRVLSDGFDRNLDRLQQLHGLRFAYDANRLRYEDGSWRIAARWPDPSCGCGTGVCKRARIAEFRARHPGVPVVHIGNGRVSDLCASEAADRVFAKDSLADVLDGAPHSVRAVRDLARRRRAARPLARVGRSRVTAPQELQRVIVVGAGFAGISAAFRLVQQGHRVTVLERATSVGGRAASGERDPDPIAARVSTADRALHALVRDAGLAHEFLPVRPVPSAFVRGGHFVPIPPGGDPGAVARIPGVRFLDALRLVRLPRLLARYRANLEPREPERAAAHDDRSLADFGTLYFGRSVVRAWMEPWLAERAPVDEREASRAAFLTRFAAERDAVAGSLAAPAGRLAAALAARLDVRTGTAALRVEAGTGRGLRVVLAAETIDADAVVLAVPAPEAARIGDALLVAAERTLLAGVRYDAAITWSAPMRADASLVPTRVRIEKRGTSPFASVAIEGGVVTAVARDPWATSHADWPDDALAKGDRGRGRSHASG